jgi:hypothetical protein
MLTRTELGEYLNSRNLRGVGVDIGVFAASSLTIFSRRGTVASSYLSIHGVHLRDYLDSWNGSNAEMERNYQITIARLARFESRTEILRMRSETVVNFVADESFDYSYAAVWNDLNLWFQKFRVGGTMSGHGYFDALADERFAPILTKGGCDLSSEELTSYGVKSAVKRFANILRIQIKTSQEDLPTWYFTKTPFQQSSGD